MAVADPVSSFAALLDGPPFAWNLHDFARDRAMSSVQADALAAELRLVLLDTAEGRIAVLPSRWQNFVAALLDRLARFHEEHPDLQGPGREKLRLSLQPRLPEAAFTAALQNLAGTGEICLDGAFVRLVSHVARLTPDDEKLWRQISPLLGAGERFRPPRVRDIANLLRRPEADIRRVLKVVGRMGLADEVAQDHFFLRATIRECVSLLADIAREAARGEFTAAQFRDRVTSGRKVAIQILDFFDRHEVTLRRGDLRRLNKKGLNLF
jgi:selenocysteine-specific elongation factor